MLCTVYILIVLVIGLDSTKILPVKFRLAMGFSHVVYIVEFIVNLFLFWEQIFVFIFLDVKSTVMKDVARQ